MKLILLSLLALVPAPVGALAADAAPTTPSAGTLQVQIIVPPSWVPMLEDDIADAFVSHIDEVFRHRGYKGHIKKVSAIDEPGPGCCLLTLNLIEWRVDPVGNINCTFTANLQTERTTRHLGVFTETTFRWMSGPGRFGLADAFSDAAEGALRQLYDALAKTNLVPGVARH